MAKAKWTPRDPKSVPEVEVIERVWGKPVLTDEVQESICDLVEKGCSVKIASRVSGVHEATVYNWIARGEGRGFLEPKPKYVAFARAVREAEARKIARHVETVFKASQESPGFATWMLERLAPTEFGRAIRLEGNDDAPIRLSLNIRRDVVERAPVPSDPASDVGGSAPDAGSPSTLLVRRDGD